MTKKDSIGVRTKIKFDFKNLLLNRIESVKKLPLVLQCYELPLAGFAKIDEMLTDVGKKAAINKKRSI